MLQLLQDELRDEQDAVDESRLAYVGNAAVDDDARIEQFVEFARRALSLLHLLGHILRFRLRLRLSSFVDQVRQRAEKLTDFLSLLDCDMNAKIAEHDAENDRKIRADERNLGKCRTQ